MARRDLKFWQETVHDFGGHLLSKNRWSERRAGGCRVVRCQHRAVPGCGHERGWQKRCGEGQPSGGRPTGKLYNRDFESAWTNL